MDAIVRFDSGEDDGSIMRGLTIRNGMLGSAIPGSNSRGGGGIFVYEASPRIEYCLVESNTATLGGGIYVEGGAPVFFFSTFRSNLSIGSGGAMQFESSEVIVDSCEFIGNNAGSSGGAIYARAGSVLIHESGFEANESFQPGGAVAWRTDDPGSLMIVEASTIRENTSLTAGGGIATLFASVPPIELRDTEICDNAPDDVFGGFIDGGGNSMCDCVGDLTGDGFVTGADLGLLLGAWGPCPPEGDCPADITGDGVVSGADLGLLLGAWGECMAP
jgi:predicted outer membrane repeat protein